MKTAHRIALAVAGQALACAATAQVTLYRDEGFQGPAYTTRSAVGNFARVGFNDRASSAIVTADRWEVCEDARFSGRCVVLRRGQYPSLAAMGLNDRVSSVREVSRSARVEDPRYAPEPEVRQDFRRRGGERLYEARLTDVRAVTGTPGQRCWMERERVEPRSDARVPGAIVGAVLGGILGHQVGGGTGRDLATVGGVVAGAAVGSHMGRGDGGDDRGRDVQRCSAGAGPARAAYWDVSYRFRGQEHRAQLDRAPGDTITVDRHGEPRY
jgi:uncharacterized protein YcfJ